MPTEQETNPHPELVRARGLVQESGMSRSDAANAINGMTHDEVDSILAGHGLNDMHEKRASDSYEKRKPPVAKTRKSSKTKIDD